MTKIETIEEWNALASELREDGRLLWQMQYDTRHPEGFHAWLSAYRRLDVEVVTHSDEIHDAIVRYKP